jgi:hypothetical protein
MFCPNCATENSVELNYCRNCGLKLDAVVEAVADQLPAGEDVESHRRRRMFERAGSGTLKLAAVIGIALIVIFVTQYEALGYFFAPALFGAIVAWIWLVFVGLGIRSFPKMFMKGSDRPSPVKVPAPTGVTSKLIEDRPFEPVPSVTENTTEHLRVPRRKDDRV